MSTPNAGITVTSSFTPWTNDVITRKEGTPANLTSLQNLAYQWDKNGNLSQRQDLKQLPTLTEVFVNDSMNRLTSSTLNGVGNLTVSYDEAGNITNKGDVGPYTYGDPLHKFIVKHPWRGILIEPQTDVFERLKSTYQEQAGRLTFENTAIGRNPRSS